jgi:hypothetical protein
MTTRTNRALEPLLSVTELADWACMIAAWRSKPLLLFLNILFCICLFAEFILLSP